MNMFKWLSPCSKTTHLFGSQKRYCYCGKVDRDLQPPAEPHSELCTETCCNKSGPSEPSSSKDAAAYCKNRESHCPASSGEQTPESTATSGKDDVGGSVQTSEIEKLLERFKDRAKAYLVYKEQLDFEEVANDATDLASDGLKILAYVRSLESKLSIAGEGLKTLAHDAKIIDDSGVSEFAKGYVTAWNEKSEKARSFLSKILPPT
jgi:hypothetical protein